MAFMLGALFTSVSCSKNNSKILIFWYDVNTLRSKYDGRKSGNEQTNLFLEIKERLGLKGEA